MTHRHIEEVGEQFKLWQARRGVTNLPPLDQDRINVQVLSDIVDAALSAEPRIPQQHAEHPPAQTIALLEVVRRGGLIGGSGRVLALLQP